MNKFLTTVTAIFVATASHAETKTATITHIEPNYETVYTNVPRNHCQDVQVPIYGTVQGKGANGGDVLTGMIIGGLIGKGVTGQDNGAAAGAVLGGVIAADKKLHTQQVITGYRIERQCNEVIAREEQRQLRNYTIWYEWRGVQGQSYTYNKYRVGDSIPVSVNIVAQ